MRLLPFRRRREVAASPPSAPSESTTDRRAFLRRGAFASATAAASAPFVAKTAFAQEEESHDPDVVHIAGTETITGLKTFSEVARFRKPGTGVISMESGDGTPYGAPPSAPTAAANGAGPLSGTYQYGYTERDPHGETPLSPVTSITVSGNTVRVTLPQPRRGISQRWIYRTEAGGSTFKFLTDLSSGGTGYFQTMFDDTTPDGSLGVVAPTGDTTRLNQFIVVNDHVKYMRSGPNAGAGVADFTIITGDPLTNGAFAIDAYGEIAARTLSGPCFKALKTGDAGALFEGYFNDLVHVPGASMTRVVRLHPRGRLELTPNEDHFGLRVEPRVALTAPTAMVQLVGPSGTTVPLLLLDQGGSGALLRDSTNLFKVEPNGGVPLLTVPEVAVTKRAAITASNSAVLLVQNNGGTGLFKIDTTGAGKLMAPVGLVGIGGGHTVNGSPVTTLDVFAATGNHAGARVRTKTWGSLQLDAYGASPGDCFVRTTNATALRLGANGTTAAVTLDTVGNVLLGGTQNGANSGSGAAKLATTATAKFPYMPSMAGPPTGVPTAKTGFCPYVFDTTNNRLYVYNGAWRRIQAV